MTSTLQHPVTLVSDQNLVRGNVLKNIKTKANDRAALAGIAVDDLLAYQDEMVLQGLIDTREQLTLTGAVFLALFDTQKPLPPAHKGQIGTTPPVPPKRDLPQIREIWRMVGDAEARIRQSIDELVEAGLAEIVEGRYFRLL